MDISPKILVEFKSPIGYVLLYEYILPDYSIVNLVKWCDIKESYDLLSEFNFCSFYRETGKALEYTMSLISSYTNGFEHPNI